MLAVMVVAGVGIFVVQKYAYKLPTPRQLAPQRRVNKLREEGAEARQNTLVPGSLSRTKIILMHSFPPWYQIKSGPSALFQLQQFLLIDARFGTGRRGG
ncbi:hypothetical protein ACOMHN_004710 [Nucella lapillus]